MDTLWQKIKQTLGGLVIIIALLIGGMSAERFLNQPATGLQAPKATYKVPKAVDHYLMPAGYLDVLIITLEDGTVLATNGTTVIQMQPQPAATPR